MWSAVIVIGVFSPLVDLYLLWTALWVIDIFCVRLSGRSYWHRGWSVSAVIGHLGDRYRMLSAVWMISPPVSCSLGNWYQLCAALWAISEDDGWMWNSGGDLCSSAILSLWLWPIRRRLTKEAPCSHLKVRAPERNFCREEQTRTPLVKSRVCGGRNGLAYRRIFSLWNFSFLWIGIFFVLWLMDWFVKVNKYTFNYVYFALWCFDINGKG